MALIKNKMTEYGFEANYWRVSRIAIDTAKKEVNFTLNLYVNKNATKELEDYTFTSILVDPDSWVAQYNNYFREDKGKNYKDIYTACYMYTKENIEFFSDAVDDEEEEE